MCYLLGVAVFRFVCRFADSDRRACIGWLDKARIILLLIGLKRYNQYI